MIVNPSAAQFGAVVETVGTAGVVSMIKLVKAPEGLEVHPPLVDVRVYAVPITAPVIVPPAFAVGPNGENV